MKVLFIGDIFGRPGRTMVRDRLSEIVRSRSIDLVIANGENAAGGFGITPQISEELFDLGISVLTTGNHIWDKREIIDYFNAANGNAGHPARRILRPANYPAGTPGFGMYEGKVGQTPYAVINLQGRVFLPSNDDPFRVVDELLTRTTAKVILVDVHAEATSEKCALGWYLDGRVTAVFGTHTHIPTADTRILPKGTAYQTDVGMTGPYDSVIGVQKDLVIHRFLTSMPARWEAASSDVHFCGVYFECDETTGRATTVERIIVPEHIGQPG
jgi:2',3'-cyclic-nucleotide 2'-phosphodiesterase